MDASIRLSQESYFKDKDFPLDVATWTEHGDYPRHVHDFSKVAIVTHGSGTADVDGQFIPDQYPPYVKSPTIRRKTSKKRWRK